MMRILTLLTAGLMIAQPSSAQLVGGGGPIGGAVSGINGAVGGVLGEPTGSVIAPLAPAIVEAEEPLQEATNHAAEVYQRQARALARQYPEQIILDDHQSPAVRGEAIAVSPTAAAIENAKAAGFTVTRSIKLDPLAIDLIVLKAPQGMSTQKAIKRLRRLDPHGVYDFDHIYLGSGDTSIAPANHTASRSSNDGEVTPLRIGLIDGGVDAAHGAFRGGHIDQQPFAGEQVVATAHGTAVGSLLVGSDTVFSGAAPGAYLFAADVYCGVPAGGSADAIVSAIAWLASENVPVVNISLVGPQNAVLGAAIGAALAKGIIIVAAVGNDGPSAHPLYPAAYPGVVGVTAVDAHNKVIVEAERGKQVEFAAPGADMAAAGLNNGYFEVRGTSFAAPIVAGLLAKLHTSQDVSDAAAAQQKLAAMAKHLGSGGRNKTYGYGLVGESVRVSPKAFVSR